MWDEGFALSAEALSGGGRDGMKTKDTYFSADNLRISSRSSMSFISKSGQCIINIYYVMQ